MTNFETHDCYTTRDADRPNVICDSNGEVVLSLCKRCGRGESQLDDEPCPVAHVPPQIAEDDAPGLYLDSGEFVPAAELNGLLQDEPGSGARGLSKALSEKPDARLRAREALAESLSEEMMRMNQQDVVLSITTAYEQGFGHALRTELRNPYAEGSCEFDAWQNGREVGARKAKYGPVWSEEQRTYLEQGARMLDEYAREQNLRGNCTEAKGAEASAYVILQMLWPSKDSK